MRLSWLTDIHLNFLTDLDQWLIDLKSMVEKDKSDALILTGDIGEAQSVTRFLERISITLGIPIYFVLGNHDFFNGWISSVRYATAALGEGTIKQMVLWINIIASNSLDF